MTGPGARHSKAVKAVGRKQNLLIVHDIAVKSVAGSNTMTTTVACNSIVFSIAHCNNSMLRTLGAMNQQPQHLQHGKCADILLCHCQPRPWPQQGKACSPVVRPPVVLTALIICLGIDCPHSSQTWIRASNLLITHGHYDTLYRSFLSHTPSSQVLLFSNPCLGSG